MKARARYTVTTVGATSVTLTPKAVGEDEDHSTEGGIFGTGTIVVTTTVTPSAGFWRTTAVGGEVLVEITKV